MILAILIIVLALAAVYKWYLLSVRLPHPDFPPGPVGLPIIGHLPTILSKDLVEGFQKLHDRYGGVFSLNLGPQKRAVVIGDYEALKEAFRDDGITGRPSELMWFNEYTRHGDGTDARGLVSERSNFHSQCGLYELLYSSLVSVTSGTSSVASS